MCHQVVSIFFIIGIIFVPIGAVCLTAAFSVRLMAASACYTTKLLCHS